LTDNVVPLREGEVVADDVAQLAAEFPEWQISADWITANSGTDVRFLVARREGVTLTGWDESALARLIRQRRSGAGRRGNSNPSGLPLMAAWARPSGDPLAPNHRMLMP
jgi:hypothetical protein